MASHQGFYFDADFDDEANPGLEPALPQQSSHHRDGQSLQQSAVSTRTASTTGRQGRGQPDSIASTSSRSTNRGGDSGDVGEGNQRRGGGPHEGRRERGTEVEDEEDEEEGGIMGTGRGGHGHHEGHGDRDRERGSYQTHHWPQSYRQSMDLYSHMASPSIPNIFSPLSHHVQGILAASPHPSHSSYRRQSGALLHHSLSGAGAVPGAPASVREEDVSLLEDTQQEEEAEVVVVEQKEEQEQVRKQAGKRTQRLPGQSKQEVQGQAEQPSLPQLRLRHHAGKEGHKTGLADSVGVGDVGVGDGYGGTAAAAAAAVVKAGSWEASVGAAQDEAEEEEDVFYEVPSGSSFVQAMLNGVNILAGVGVLSTPYALMQAGWLGLLLLLFLALVCCYTGLLLRKCLDSEPGLETYPDIGEAAFGQTGRLLISIVLYVELYACCVEFLILEGDNLGALFPSASVSLGPISLSPRHLFVLLAALAVLPTMYLRDLSLLSYVSAGGVLASLVVVTCVSSIAFLDVGFPFATSGQLLNPPGLPVAIGLFGFCFSGHAVFPNIYMSMRERHKFDTVLYCSFAFCTLLYGGIAVMGYCMFGPALANQITLNLPRTYLPSHIAIWTTVVNPFTKYALSMTPVALCLEELLPMDPRSEKHRQASLLIRTVLVTSTVAAALLVPFFGYVMAFIGSFLSMTVSVILPCACYLRILGPKATLSQTIACVLLITVGVICAIAGTFAAVQGIAGSIAHPDTLGLQGSFLTSLVPKMSLSMHGQ